MNSKSSYKMILVGFSQDGCKDFSRLGDLPSHPKESVQYDLKVNVFVKFWLRFSHFVTKIFAVLIDYGGNLFQEGCLPPVDRN